MNVTIRAAQPADAVACGQISYAAFKAFRERHGFPAHFPTVEAAIGRAEFCINHPSSYGVVAECEGQVIGSNFLDERDPIRGLGPITVDPHLQAKGVGRQLMEAVLKRAQGSTGVRLVADSFSMSSVSLYASLGFEIKEPLLLMSGRPASKPSREIEVRPLENDDVGDCAVLCGRVHGCERTNELRDAVINLSPLVAFREGKVAGYVLTFTTWPSNHAVADGEEAIQSSLLAAAILNSGPLSFLLPVRQANLYRWCLSEGFRAVLPMTLMALGKYQDPDGFYMSSILY